jgi:hypothetical protein
MRPAHKYVRSGAPPISAIRAFSLIERLTSRNNPVVFGFVESPRASDGVPIAVGLLRALECNVGVCAGLALGIFHRALSRLIMKLRFDGLWSGWAARRPGHRVPDISLELSDL